MAHILRKFEVINREQFSLPNTDGIGATHIATIQYGMREFVYFMINTTGQTYIEEVILRPTVRNNRLIAKYQYIDDDQLWADLAGFLDQEGLTKPRPFGIESQLTGR